MLVLTTPELVDALAMQEALEQRYALPVDLKPMELGQGRELYRVSIRAPETRRRSRSRANWAASWRTRAHDSDELQVS